jgi:hypothetical protein
MGPFFEKIHNIILLNVNVLVYGKKATSNVAGGGKRLTNSVTAGGKGNTPPANECNPGTFK